MNYRIVGPRLVQLIFVAIIAVLLAGLMARSRPTAGGEAFFGCIFFGAACGLSIVGAIWSGLFGQSWIRSYLEATGLAMLLTLILPLVGSAHLDLEVLSPVLAIPLFAIAFSVPLWIMRYLRGWQLLCERPPTQHTKVLGIEDILLFTSLFASAIMLVRSSTELANLPNAKFDSAWLSLVGGSAVAGLITSPFSLIATRIGLNSKTVHDLFGKLIKIWLSIWLGFVVLIMVLSRGRLDAEAVFLSFIGSMSAFSVLGVGLKCFVGDGNQLYRRVNATDSRAASEADYGDSPQDPFACEKTASTGLAKPSRWPDRGLAIGTLAAAVLISYFSSLQQPKKVAIEVDSLTSRLEKLKNLEPYGQVDQQDGYLFGFKANEDCYDEILVLLKSHPSLESLDLSNSRITNLGASHAVQLPGLKFLCLGKTRVTNGIFEDLTSARAPLETLDLSHTSIFGTGLINIDRIIRCDKLILRGLSLEPEDIDRRNSVTRTLFDLRGARLTGVPAKAQHLILGDNGLPPESICQTSTAIKTVGIDGLEVTDEIFNRFLKTHKEIRALSLSNTKQTGQSLAYLSNVLKLRDLTLGPGTLITERDLIEQHLPIWKLRINIPDFKGSFLSSISKHVVVLDLAHSGVDDDSIRSLGSSGSFKFVSIAHTSATTDSLVHLIKLNIQEIDIRGTSIRATDLLAANYSHQPILIVDENQFTSEERTLIKEQTGFKLKLESTLDKPDQLAQWGL